MSSAERTLQHISPLLQVDYSEQRSHRRNGSKSQAAALRRRAAAATLGVAPARAPVAKTGPWLDLTPGARFTPEVQPLHRSPFHQLLVRPSAMQGD